MARPRDVQVVLATRAEQASFRGTFKLVRQGTTLGFYRTQQEAMASGRILAGDLDSTLIIRKPVLSAASSSGTPGGGGGVPGPGSPPPVDGTVYKDLGNGTFPDVAFFGGRIYVAYQPPIEIAGLRVVRLLSFATDLTDQQIEQDYQIGENLAFARLSVSGGILWWAWNDGGAMTLWRSDTEARQVLQNPSGGTDPHCFGFGKVAYQQGAAASFAIKREDLPPAGQTAIGSGNATGLSRVKSDGTVVTIDQDRNAVSYGTRAWFVEGSTLVIAEATDPSPVHPTGDNGVNGQFGADTGTRFKLWPHERTLTPHAATDGAGKYAVVTWDPRVRIAAWST